MTVRTRYVVLDTETTGLSPRYHRLAEVGCVEIAGGRITGNYFHSYINPCQRMTRGAQAVHGLKDEFLATQPTFGAIAQRLLYFLCGAVLVGHNLTFDLNFLDAGLVSAGFMPAARYCAGVIDTMRHLAQRGSRRRFSLDDLCDRLGVRRGERARHGALEDAVLLAEAFVAARRTHPSLGDHGAHRCTLRHLGHHPGLPVVLPVEEDLRAHDYMVLRMLVDGSDDADGAHTHSGMHGRTGA
ncbi:DNA polymerase III subunit epsilon [Candidatus Tremblaya princeps]|uniref:DNA-directed DNA polymerase n=1 Tax=Tremblaya princeps TaxID=189385 RepID=A0A143WNH5_TREPR|nr:DNA polymerase III subunit epsilon [Candidatus Tremblaya princeps]